jgi:hypothetical protein
MSIKSDFLISRSDLAREFTAVRKVYFPKWDRMRRWRCRFLRATMVTSDCHGRCDDEKKIIYISKNAEDLIALLIHEICHAVTQRANEGRTWQERMLKAVKVADRIGHSRLAESLRQEVVSYQRDAEIITKKANYCDIEECVSDLTGIPPFPKVAKLVAHKHLMTVEKFLKRLPRAKAVYDEAVQFKRGS